MSTSATWDELTITPAQAPISVNTGEIELISFRLASAAARADTFRRLAQLCDLSLGSGQHLPGAAASAYSARSAVQYARACLQEATSQLDVLAGRAGAAALEYALAEHTNRHNLTRVTAARYPAAGPGGSFSYATTTFRLLPFGFDVSGLRDRVMGWATRGYLNRVTDDPRRGFLGSSGTLTTLFAAGYLRYSQLRGLNPWQLTQFAIDTAGTARGTAIAGAPAVFPNAPGLSRAQSAEFAHHLSGFLSPGGDSIGVVAGAGGKVVDGLHVSLGNPVVVTMPIPPRPEDLEPGRAPKRTFADAVAIIAELDYQKSTDPGEVRLDKITDPHGGVAWQVFIPGAQGMDLNNAHALPHTMKMLDGELNQTAVMVVQAMAAAGVSKGQPVTMVGHSQGGLAASALANHDRVREAFDIDLVVTFGSPLDRHEIRPDTQIVALEHVEDLVPGLDGVDQQGRRNISTVTRVLADSNNPETAAGVGPRHAHDYPTYIETAALVDVHPGMAQQRAILEATVPAGTVETFRYRARMALKGAGG